MNRSTRISLFITVMLFLITFAPLFAFALGLFLNSVFGCNIRDESGTVYGNCSEWQSGIVYPLMIMPWLMLVTMPFVGIPTVIAFIVTVILFVRTIIKKRRS
jgi:hypothetical protein